MIRCKWCNLKNEKYIEYHDKEWCKSNFEDKYLFEMLILESFQAGLSWETILNKRDNFRKAFDNFDWSKIVNYGEDKINELMQDKGIIRNRRKIEAVINNTKIFMDIQKEYGSFAKYIWSFTNNQVIITDSKVVSNELSDTISKELRKRGMKFVGTVIVYSYLQAIGVINSHELVCFKGVGNG